MRSSSSSRPSSSDRAHRARAQLARDAAHGDRVEPVLVGDRSATRRPPPSTAPRAAAPWRGAPRSADDLASGAPAAGPPVADTRTVYGNVRHTMTVHRTKPAILTERLPRFGTTRPSPASTSRSSRHRPGSSATTAPARRPTSGSPTLLVPAPATRSSAATTSSASPAPSAIRSRSPASRRRSTSASRPREPDAARPSAATLEG